MRFLSPGYSTRLPVATALAACLVIAGCGSMPEPPKTPAAGASASTAPKGRLSDTAWRLVEIQSMDESVGTKRPDVRNR